MAGPQKPFGTQVGKHAKLILEQVHSQVLAAITVCNTTLMDKMEEIKVDIGLLRKDM